MASKILVLGDVNGQLKVAFAKLTTVHSKNNFTFCIATGNLFAEDNDAVADLLAGKITVPLTTYFTVGTSPLPQRIIEKIQKDEEICPNLHFLGKRSTTTTSEGVKIVVLGGQLDETIVGGLSQEQYLPYHTVGDAKALHGANTADILLTSVWPASVTIGSKVMAAGITFPEGLAHVAELCATLKPRYHFSSSPNFLEREPFFHVPTEDSPDFRPITRFISLAAYGTPRQKFLYAFSLPPASADPTVPLPFGCTASPFSASNAKKRRSLDPEPYSRYGNNDHGGGGYKRRKGRGAQPITTPDQCFFCVSSESSSDHLIFSLTDDAYIASAKGPLTTSTVNAALGVDFPAHALIIPLSHSPTLAMVDAENREKTFQDMAKYREALQNMIAKLSGNKLGAVTFEISKARGIHTHWQFIPMPAETIQKGLVEAAFRVEASDLSYPAFKERDPGLGLEEGDFFRTWIWTPPSEDAAEGSTKCLTMDLDHTVKFSLQFGRIVIAKLLGLQNRLQWRDCQQTVDEEKADCAALKNAFAEFDFS